MTYLKGEEYMLSNDRKSKVRTLTARRVFSLLLYLVLIVSLLPLAVPRAEAADTTWSVGVSSISTGARFTISRSGDISASVTVKYRTVSLSAFAGQNFTGKTGQLTFGPNEPSKYVDVTETSPSSSSYTFQYGTKRQYRFEVTDMGGFLLASADRDVTAGTSVPYSGVFDEKTLTLQSSEFKITDDGYINNPYKTAAASAYFGTSVPRDYLQAINATLSLKLSMDVREADDGYQYIQVLTDNTSSCDDRSKCDDGDPGNMNLSFYMAGFGHVPGTKNTTYATYTFPVSANNGDTGVWDNGVTNKLYMQKRKNSLTNAGGIRLPMDFTTLVVRFNASGDNDDDWYAKNVKAHVTALDGERPHIESITVSPGMHARGNDFYVSIAFSELMHVGSAYLYTNWCDAMNLVAGDYSNVLTFKGTVKSGASGPLSITGISSAASDLYGNQCTDSVVRNNICALDASYVYSISVVDDLGDGAQRNAAHTSYSYETPAFTLTNPTDIMGCRFDGWTGSNGTMPQNSVSIPRISGGKYVYGDLTYTANWTDFWGVRNGAAGTATDPYVISDAAGLVWLQNRVDAGDTFDGKFFTLAGDIDMQGVSFHGIGDAFTSFMGSFDGGGHAVQNLTASSGIGYAGLFGRISGATITNVILDGASVSDYYAGAVAGYAENSVVTNCFVLNSTVDGTIAAPFVGDGSATSNCYARHCTVKGQTVNTVYTVTAAIDGVTVSCDDDVPTYQNITYYPAYSTVTLGYSGQIQTGYRAPTDYRADSLAMSGSSFSMPAHDVTNVRPIFVPIEYVVTFHSNYGSDAVKNQAFIYNQTQPLTLSYDFCAAPAGGYTFDKWTTSPDGSGDSYTDGQLVSNLTAEDNGSVDLYAQWKPIPWTGTGATASDPYVILYPSQLMLIAENVNGGQDFYQYKYLRLDADLDMSGFSFPGIGIEKNGTYHEFRGEFDGNGHTISNVTVSQPDRYGFAVFSRIGLGGIKNLTIDGASITASTGAGILVYMSYKAYIENCVVLNSTVTLTGSDYHYGAILADFSSYAVSLVTEEKMKNNYYRNCTITVGSEVHTSDMGYRDADRDGARGVHRLTLSDGVTASGETVTIGGVTYFADGTTVTLSGGSYGYTVNGENVYFSFTMPAADVTASANASLTLTHFPAVAATCTAPGNAEYWRGSEGNYYADENGQTLTGEETVLLPALGHDWEWVRVAEPTCTEPGEERRTCSRCGEIETRPVAALGHDFGDGEVCLHGCGAQVQPVTTWAELLTAASTDGLVKLGNAITRPSSGGYLYIQDNHSVILDLNGFELNLGQSFIGIRHSSTLTIRDSSPNETGVITGGDYNSTGGCIWMITNFGGSPALILQSGTLAGNLADQNGGAVYMDGGTFTMTGGTISNNGAGSNGGGVYVRAGVFTMTGGTISNNDAGSNGGGVYTYEGAVFVLNGGTITGNRAGDTGGGIYVYLSDFTLATGTISGNSANSAGGIYSNVSFTLPAGSVISGNTASFNGGGVQLERNAVLTISGGEISGNVAGTTGLGGGIYMRQASSQYPSVVLQSGSITGNTAGDAGGGVYMWARSSFTMTGGTITGNTAGSKGGGIYCNGNSRVSVSGLVNVTGNTKSNGTAPNNVFLNATDRIRVTGDLTAGSAIGVTTSGTPEETAPITLTDGLNGRSPDFLIDDNENPLLYSIFLTSDGEAVRGVAQTYTVTAAACEHGTIAADADAYRAGETVTLTLTPENGYGAQSVSYVDQYSHVVTIAFSTGSTVGTFAMPKRNVTVSAVFVPLNDLSYTVTYVNAVNGTDGVTNPNPVSYTQTGSEIVLQDPSRDYFIFNGWTYEGQTTPTKNVTIPAGSTGDKTFTAHWTADYATWWGADADGTSANPYRISNAGGLALLSIRVNSGANTFNSKYFELTDDIFFPHGSGENEDNFTAIGTDSHPFRGILEGNGHTISGLRVNKGTSAVYQGLFGCLSGTVRNFTLDDAEITGLEYVGGIAGRNNGTIQNCVVTSAVVLHGSRASSTAGFVAGIAGASNGSVTNCRSSVHIVSVYNVWNSAIGLGGIVGNVWGSGEIRACFAEGVRIETNDGNSGCRYVGAIVGQSNGNLSGNYYRGCSIADVTAGIGVGGQGRIGSSTDEAGKAEGLIRVTVGPGVILGTAPTFTESGIDYYAYGTSILLSDDGQAGYTSDRFVVTDGSDADVTAEVVHDEFLGKFLTVPDYDVSVTAVRKKLMTNPDITITIPAQTYSGTELTPVVTVTDGETVLSAGTDYYVSQFGSCEAAGSYAVTVSAQDDSDYYGATIVFFTVAPRPVTIRAADQTAASEDSIVTTPDMVYVSGGSLVDGHSIMSIILTVENGAIIPREAIIGGSFGEVTQNYAITYAPGTLNGAEAAPVFNAHALVLCEEIGVKFRVAFPAGFDTTGVYMDFQVADGRKSTVTWNQSTADGSDARWFVCKVNALELGDNIVATLHYGTNKTVTDEFSAVQYCQYVQTHSTDYTAELLSLVNALRDYGYYMQQSGWTDGKTHTDITAASTLNEGSIAAAQSDLAGFGVVKHLEGTGIASAQYSLTLNTQTMINVFFKPEDGVTITSPGLTETTLSDGTYYQFTTDLINTGNLGRMYTASVETSLGQTAEIQVSAMSYVKAVLDSDAFNLQKKLAMTAYYNYYAAAIDYAKQP